MSRMQIVLENSPDSVIYRSDPIEVTETMDITEVVIQVLQNDCIDLAVGDTLKIMELT